MIVSLRRALSGLAVLALLVASARAVEIVVAPGGSDAQPGTAAAPVATLARARDLARQQNQAGQPVTVVLQAGTHYLSEPLTLTPGDSGSQAAPIVYAGQPGQKVIVSGGRKLQLEWTTYKNGIFQAAVPGVKEGKVDFDQFFVDGRRQHLARYPNYDAKQRVYGGTAADAISPQRVRRWANPAGAIVHALHGHEWGGVHYRVTGVDAQGNPKLEGGWQNNRPTGMHPRHRFVENVFEELDAPGEWYLDRAKGILYFMPPAGVDLKQARIEVAGLKRLVELRGTADKPVRFVTFRGLTFTHTGRTFMEKYEPLLRSDWCIHRGGAVLLEGTEDCRIEDCRFDAVGGNAVFVSAYNRRVAIAGCKVTEAGASAVCFVGSRDAVRSPADQYGHRVPADKLDRAPGPKSPDYPAQCRVEDCLLCGLGRFEKQTAGVQIAMAEEITVSHCSIYDCPRAGINIGDGCWGGHVIEFCDVFDTVRETGDHGSFNSWGRDRYWSPHGRAVNKLVAETPEAPLWDCRKTIVLRNNRWRCDHGWDIDLDDGSSNYRIENNLCLNGGLKLREGFHRTAANNVIVNNTFHPHVWFENSGDVFTRNIVARPYAPIGMPGVWGRQIDYNFFLDPGALARARQLKLDAHSATGDAKFIDPSRGDYRVRDDSPALAVGFKNFPMDQFGVVKPELRAEARTPLGGPAATAATSDTARPAAIEAWLGAKVKAVTTLGEVSAAGLPGTVGVILLEVPAGCAAEKAGLQRLDVILTCNGKPVNTPAELTAAQRAAAPGSPARLEVFRRQQRMPIVLRSAK